MAGHKGMPAGPEPIVGHRVLDDTLMLPLAVLKESALTNNVAWMQRFAGRLGLSLAPHGKTTMAPALFRRQLDAGAWGMTAATAHHVRLYASWGVRRILMANQLVGAANLEAVLGLLCDDDALEIYLLVDSVEGVGLLADAARRHGVKSPQVLLEVGAPGQRAGVRTVEAALAVAEACRGQAVALRGVETFEGVFADPQEAEGALACVNRTAEALDRAGLFAPGEIVLSAGGSALFDLAAQAMRAARLSRATRLVLRSGCYIAHDSLLYERAFEAACARMPELRAIGGLLPALEVWAHVQSRPEPVMIVASLGRRDIGHDAGPPVPLWRHRPGEPGAPRPFAKAAVTRLFDQHACVAVDPADDLQVGDLVAFGVSHPCTTFDKWRLLALVDDDYRVTGVVETWF